MTLLRAQGLESVACVREACKYRIIHSSVDLACKSNAFRLKRWNLKRWNLKRWKHLKRLNLARALTLSIFINSKKKKKTHAAAAEMQTKIQMLNPATCSISSTVKYDKWRRRLLVQKLPKDLVDAIFAFLPACKELNSYSIESTSTVVPLCSEDHIKYPFIVPAGSYAGTYTAYTADPNSKFTELVKIKFGSPVSSMESMYTGLGRLPVSGNCCFIVNDPSTFIFQVSPVNLHIEDVKVVLVRVDDVDSFLQSLRLGKPVV